VLELKDTRNVSAQTPRTLEALVPASERTDVLAVLPVEGVGEIDFRVAYSYMPGDPTAVHRADEPYRVPFAIGKRYRVTQAYPSQVTHVTPASQYAVDMALPVGTAIYAARAGTNTRYWWGDEVGEAQACCDGCGSPWDGQQSSPVGSFPANAFGLVDALGNVWEWVEDAWHQDYLGAPADGSAWAGNGSLRVARGGAWNYVPRHTSCASRVSYTVDHRSSNLGFRVALTL